MRATIPLENVLSTRCFDHRRAAREEIALPVVIVVGATRHNALLRNLSSGGAMIVTSAHLIPNTTVKVESGTMCARGTVIWQRGSDYGIRFDNRVSERELDEQVSRSNAVKTWRKVRLHGSVD